MSEAQEVPHQSEETSPGLTQKQRAISSLEDVAARLLKDAPPNERSVLFGVMARHELKKRQPDEALATSYFRQADPATQWQTLRYCHASGRHIEMSATWEAELAARPEAWVRPLEALERLHTKEYRAFLHTQGTEARTALADRCIAELDTILPPHMVNADEALQAKRDEILWLVSDHTAGVDVAEDRLGVREWCVARFRNNTTMSQGEAAVLQERLARCIDDRSAPLKDKIRAAAMLTRHRAEPSFRQLAQFAGKERRERKRAQQATSLDDLFTSAERHFLWHNAQWICEDHLKLTPECAQDPIARHIGWRRYDEAFDLYLRTLNRVEAGDPAVRQQALTYTLGLRALLATKKGPAAEWAPSKLPQERTPSTIAL